MLIVLDQVLSVAGLLAVVELAGHAPDWTIPAVTVLYSFTRPFSQGSFFSALADIAGAELLDQASAIEATSLNLAIVVGPAMAGALAGIIGAAETVELQAVLTVVVAVLVGVNPAFEARPAERPDERLACAAHRAARRSVASGCCWRRRSAAAWRRSAGA